MSTINLAAVDPGADTVEAVTDSVAATAAAAGNSAAVDLSNPTGPAPADSYVTPDAPVDATASAPEPAAPDATAEPGAATDPAAPVTAGETVVPDGGEAVEPLSSGTAEPGPAVDATTQQVVPDGDALAVGEQLPALDGTVESVGGVTGENVGAIGDAVEGLLPGVNDTIGNVGDAVDGLLPGVNDTIGNVGDAVDGLLPGVGDTVEDTLGLTLGSLSELLGATSLLDLYLDLNLGIDAAAPISATVAANANVAAPINAAVSANLLSPGSLSLATADQQALLYQTLVGEANAISNQVSDIMQGEIGTQQAAGADEVLPASGEAATAAAEGGSTQDAGASGAASVVPAAADAVTTAAEAADDGAGQVTSGLGSALLNVDLNLDLDVNAAAPISATVAANANVAAPIDAAVSANVLSPAALSLGTANQGALISQTLIGEANAHSDQISAIMQGEDAGGSAT